MVLYSLELVSGKFTYIFLLPDIPEINADIDFSFMKQILRKWERRCADLSTHLTAEKKNVKKLMEQIDRLKTSQDSSLNQEVKEMSYYPFHLKSNTQTQNYF